MKKKGQRKMQKCLSIKKYGLSENQMEKEKRHAVIRIIMCDIMCMIEKQSLYRARDAIYHARDRSSSGPILMCFELI